MDYGPPQAWQMVIWQKASFLSPIRRLHRVGHYGLLVGKGWTYCGGLRNDIALKMEQQGLLYIEQRPCNSLRAYACQLSFNFDL